MTLILSSSAVQISTLHSQVQGLQQAVMKIGEHMATGQNTAAQGEQPQGEQPQGESEAEKKDEQK